VAQLFGAPRYQSEGRGFDCRWRISCRTMNQGSTQSPTEISTTIISCWEGGDKRVRCVGLTTVPHSWPILSKSGSLSVLWPILLACNKPVQGLLYLYLLCNANIPINPLNPELNPICYLLALLGAHHLLHVSRIRVKSLTLRLLMSYVYGAPILDVSRSHTTMQHSR